MAQPEDKASAGLIDGERMVPPQVNGAGETPLGVLGTPEPLLRLQRTRGVWQIPELATQDAGALLELWPPGSFLVTGHNSSQVLVLRTGASPGEVCTYQIQKLPGGVSLEYSNLCMPDLPHLLAFLSASRDVLPRTLLLPPPTLRPGDQQTGLAQTGGVQLNISEKVLPVVNKLYLETHGGWGLEQITAETSPGTAERHSSAPRNPAPHRVSWVEGPLSPEGYHPGPTLASLVEEKEKEDEDEDEDSYKDEEKGPDDVLTHHIQALARARSNYVGRQFQGLRARLTSNAGGPHRPGDPATELLQDVRHLLTDLQDHLSKDPDVRAVFGSRGPGVLQKEEDLGNKEDWEGIYGQCPDPLGFSFAISGPYVCVSHPTSFSPSVYTCLLFHSRAFPSLREHLSHGRQPYSTPRLPLAHVFPPMSTLVGGQKPGRAGAGGGGGGGYGQVEREGGRGSAWRPFAHRPQPLTGAALEAALCRAVLEPLKPALWTRLRTLRARELRRLRQRQTAPPCGAASTRAWSTSTPPAPHAARWRCCWRCAVTFTRAWLRARTKVKKVYARLPGCAVAGELGRRGGRRQCARRGERVTRSSRGRLRGPGDPPRGVCRPSEVEGQPALVFWGSDRGVCTPAIHLGARSAPPEPLGADAFLPALTEELIWSPHIGETQLDVEFLMELLDPDELRGEAGYYLTTWFGALHHIAHYQPDVGRAPQGLSSEARASLRQWHSRRTLHRQDRQDRGAQVQLPFEEPWARDTVPRDGL
ncbi:ras and Rab interactor-like protein isoform X2 [Lynx canadensis]|uniref:ras and Rab interactor-like protein isoform X2 n=1 Tax=Lynx canadensis TaxID=61383 RepID=UPI0011AFE8FD|nr:ras and Rab interactor-like protein isoform X2 [Lynx canadensis]